jgi:hypothetical protein
MQQCRKHRGASAKISSWPVVPVAGILPSRQLSGAKLPLTAQPGARLTTPLDQRTIGSDHVPVAPEVVNIVYLPALVAGFFLSSQEAGCGAPSLLSARPC